jgi:hypothetical protein
MYTERLDADPGTDFFSSAGVIAINTEYTVYAVFDWATGAMTADVNGVQVINGTYGTTGNSDATNSTNFYFGLALAGGNYLSGSLGRIYMSDKVQTAGEKTSILGYINEVAI